MEYGRGKEGYSDPGFPSVSLVEGACSPDLLYNALWFAEKDETTDTEAVNNLLTRTAEISAENSKKTKVAILDAQVSPPGRQCMPRLQF